MSTVMDDEIKRWTARRKSALVLEIIQGKTTVAEASRSYDLPPSEIETWIEEGKRGMENALRANPQDVREQYEQQLKDLQEAYGEAMLELRARKKPVPAGRGREMIETIRQGLKEDGYSVSISQLCRWFGVPRRTVYYRPTRKTAVLQERFCKPIKQLIEEQPSFGYRTVAHLLGFNKNTVQRILQLMRWQVKKRPVGFRPRVQAMPSVAAVPNERWATDLCRVWSGRDGWATLALVMDCHSRELLGWHLSRSGRSKTAESALEQALIARFGTLGRVPTSFLLRSDNGLVFTSRSYTTLVRSYGLRQEFITPHSPEQNGMVERLIRTLKEQCVHRHRFETLQHASRVIGDWVGFYNTRRPHQALGMRTPAEAFALAA
jgi:putative transposase